MLLIAVAAVFGLTLLAPLASLANTDLSTGQLAIVENPNGSGAYLRSDITVLDETTVVTELAQGTTVALTDGPIITDDGVWFWVATADGLEGFVSDAMLTAAPVEDAVPEVAEPVADEVSTETETVTEDAPVSPDLLWQEPIDAGFVVDNNSEIPAEGLACRATATVDGEILARVPVNATLQVVAPRIWIGEQSFVHINCADGAGYVNGAYVVLQSEQAAEEPVVEEVVTEDVVTDPAVEEVITEPVVEDVVTEPVVEEVLTEPVTEEVVTEPVVEDVVTEPVAEEVVTDPVTEDVVTDPVTEEIVTEPVVEEAVTEPTTEEVVTDPAPDAVAEPVTDEVVTEEVATDPVVEEVVTEETGTEAVTEDVTTEVATETDASTETTTETVDEAATETDVTTETVADEVTTEVATETESTTESAEVTTETETTTDAVETTTESATDTVSEEEAVSTETETATTTEDAVEDVDTDTATEVAKTVEDTDTESDTTTEKVAVQSEPVVPAVTAPASDIDKMIGSATVTGTNGEGLKCRAAPDAGSAMLMVLEEGTKVYVLQEPVNGYLGIDCGGLQGFADVNFLWSGGAGDGEITKSSMTLVVSGTGNGLNCRTGASTSYPVITVLYDGTTVKTRGAASNGWVPVTCAGQAGHVATPYVEVASGGSTSGGGSTTTTGKATVVNTNGDGLYCRSGAGTSYSAITILSPGQTVSVRGANQGSWTPIICGNTNGFAHSSFLSISAGSTSGGSTSGPTAPTTSTGKVKVTGTNGDGLNCRSGASTSHGVITVLRPDQTVDTRSGSTSGWQAVICGGQNGFVSSQFVTAAGGSSTPAPAPSAPAPSTPSGMVSGDRAKTTANLNLRYDASLGSSVAAVAPTGTVVKITGGLSNGFYAVDWDGLRGYMSSDYLTKTSEALSERGGSGTPTTTTPPSSGSGSGTATGNAVVDYAMRYLGYPYVWATHGPASFDCSGFTYWVVKNVIGKDIGYGTWTQVAAGTRVSRANLQPGDLVFFQNTYTAGLSHVGIYIGNNKFIHAQNEETGVVISDLDSSYYGPRWYGAVRL